ncbi:MAG: hypothetical protein ACYTFO_08305 [Planctomycetota bacterium]|jgi:Flp pilus assembly pilin Flp
MRIWRRIRRFWLDQRGQATLEYALMLAAVVLPLMMVFRRLLQALADMFALVTLLLSLPFP